MSRLNVKQVQPGPENAEVNINTPYRTKMKVPHKFHVNNVMVQMSFLRIMVLHPKGEFFGNAL